MKHIINPIKSFSQVVNLQTIIVVSLACITTFVCIEYDVIIELPTALIGIAIVFPIVFSINAAYRRREDALKDFGSLKGHAIALYYAHRDWIPESTPDHSVRMKAIFDELLNAIYVYLTGTGDRTTSFENVYGHFSRLSNSMEVLRAAGVSGSEISRCNQYLRAMMIDFERMRNISCYRTPTTLRAYSQVFLNIFPILFAPYFAYISSESYDASGYVVAIVYGLVLVSLDNIQEDLENPFDGIGSDDLRLDIAQHYENILTNTTQ